MIQLSLKRISLVYISLFFILIFTSCSSDQNIDPGKIAEYNKPAVVYIQTFWKGSVSFPTVTINETELTSYANQVYYQRRMTAEELVGELIEEMLRNPDRYLIPGQLQQKEVSSGVSGSGMVITPDGYVVTNAHVVKKEDDELKQMVIQQAFQEQINEDVQQTIKDLQASNITLNQDHQQKLIKLYEIFYSNYMTILPKPEIHSFVNLGATIPGYGNVQKGYPAEVKKVGEPAPGKDIAILKINTNNLPTVTISDDKVNIQDNVIAMGYPGIATMHEYLTDDQSNIVPTTTAGTISAFKKMGTGAWEVYQHDVAITHGNSGGPLFNSRGEVIGINTFVSGKINYQTGSFEQVQGFGFSIPALIIDEFLHELNVTPQTGKMTELYREAIDYYFDNHFEAARDIFKEIYDASSSFPYVQEMKEKCIAEINAGRNVPLMPWPLIIIAAVVLAGGLIFLFVFVMPKRKKFSTTPIPPVVPPADQPESIKTDETQIEFKPEKPAETVTSAKPRFCSECGTKLEINDKFCSNCGHKV